MLTGAFPASYRNGLRYLDPLDAQAFLKEYANRENDQRSRLLLELIVGVFGRVSGYVPKYSPSFRGQVSRPGDRVVPQLFTLPIFNV
jgi:hypothetical protein